jgi:RNA polymerase sigma-70 factor (sigma-E family)
VADVGAFDAFVAARGPSLWRTAWLLTGDHHRAEDLVQTALAKAWPHFEGADNFEGYVRRTMVNTYSAWWRRRWTQEIPHADAGDAEVYADAPGDPDLMAALGRLPRAQRTVLVLRYFDGLTERETAAQMGIAVGTVKSHSSRALSALRGSPLLRIEEHP